MKTTLIPFLTLCLVSSSLCVAEEKSALERLKKLYEKNLESGKELYEKNVESGKDLTEKTKDWVKGDIENMGDWEYKIVHFEAGETTELEKKLNQLGTDRWQCFWVEANGKGKVFYFKRTKVSVIDKIPAADLIRIIGDSDK